MYDFILYFQPNKKEETVRRIYYPLILGLLFISSIYGQALEDGLWQLQNPNQMNISSLLSFDKGIITNGSMDMTTGQMGEAKGTYKCSGKNLLINIYNDQYSYTITWVNKDKLILNSVGNKLILAKSGTAEDTYFKRYIDWYGMFGYGSGGSYGGSGGGSSYSPPKQEICYTCRGVKRCKICEGAGQWKNSFAPFEWHKCSACEGTGKCWHCKGTGIQ